MFEKFLSSSARDFQARYEGTFGYFTNKGKKTLVQLATVDTESGTVYFRDIADMTYHLNADAEDADTGFEFLPPRSNWHNTANGPYLVQRKAARQWQRGVSPNNIAIYNLRLQGQRVDFPALSAIFDKPVDVQTAVAQGGDGFAVSQELAVNVSYATLYLFSEGIGSVVKNKDVYQVKLNNPDLFNVEVRDAFARANLKLEMI